LYGSTVAACDVNIPIGLIVKGADKEYAGDNFECPLLHFINRSSGSVLKSDSGPRLYQC
jgi:hypothetical protein